jgi:hypothetical protein
MYESYTVLISALLLAGQKSTVDDGAAAVVLLAACGFLVTLWVPSRTLRRARRISAGHTWVPPPPPPPPTCVWPWRCPR